MNYFVISLFVCLSMLAGTKATCYKPSAGEPINWNDTRLSGTWRWAVNTNDKFTLKVKCSLFSVLSQGTNVTMRMRFGSLYHQVFFVTTAEKIKDNEYKLPESFTKTWNNVILHAYKLKSVRTLKHEADNLSNHIAFYTDYKNYIIAVICMPDSQSAVWGFTKRRFIIPTLVNRIEEVLEKHLVINAQISKTVCPSAVKKSITAGDLYERLIEME